MTRSQKRARARIRSARTSHNPSGGYRDPFTAAGPLNVNPNRGKHHAARQGLDGFDPATGKYVPLPSDIKARDARRDYRPLTVRTPITRDRAGRRLPAAKQAETSYTI